MMIYYYLILGLSLSNYLVSILFAIILILDIETHLNFNLHNLSVYNCSLQFNYSKSNLSLLI